jgi:hypothetical protein
MHEAGRWRHSSCVELTLSGIQAEQLIDNVDQASEAISHCHKVASLLFQHLAPPSFAVCNASSIHEWRSPSRMAVFTRARSCVAVARSEDPCIACTVTAQPAEVSAIAMTRIGLFALLSRCHLDWASLMIPCSNSCGRLGSATRSSWRSSQGARRCTSTTQTSARLCSTTSPAPSSIARAPTSLSQVRLGERSPMLLGTLTPWF